MPKIEIVIDYNEDQTCDKCGNIGAMDFAGELLCLQCVHNDVFETMNENNN
jgi:hypothetical protein